MSVKPTSDFLHLPVIAANSQSVNEAMGIGPYLTSMPYRSEKKISNVEDFSLLFQRGEGADFIKKERPLPISQFEYNKLIIIHKAKTKLSFDTEFLERHSLSHKKDMKKRGIKADKKKQLFLPTVSSSILKINSQKNLFKHPTTVMQPTSTKERGEHERIDIMRRSPGNGICVKIGFYKKNKPKPTKSLFDLLNHRDYVSQIVQEKVKSLIEDKSISSIQSLIKSHKKSKELDKASNVIEPRSKTQLKRNRKPKRGLDRNANASQQTEEQISYPHIDKSYLLSHSAKNILLPKMLSMNKKQDQAVMKALHQAQLDHLKDIIDPKGFCKGLSY